MPLPYEHHEVESRWQRHWASERAHSVDLDRTDPARKLFNLVEFPYPSAEGLHIGHALTYSGADTWGRYQRRLGFTVYQPFGFDAFGINAENYTLGIGENPRRLIGRTVDNYRRQIVALGGAWNWDSEVVTSDPAYYRWTQWVFLRLHDAGLAYQAEAPVLWCPSCLTVLAREQVDDEDGEDRCERCGAPVVERVMRQWFLRITAYADRLLDGIDALDWPEKAKNRQRAWIGRRGGSDRQRVVPPARLAHLPPALLGAAHSDHPLWTVRDGARPRRRPAGRVARCRGSGGVAAHGHGRLAPGLVHRLGQRAVSEVRRSGPEGDRRLRHVLRLVVVLPALPVLRRRRPAVGPRAHGPLAAGRPVRRRPGACGAPSPVRPVRHHGAARRGLGAVRRAVSPDPAARLPHPAGGQDVEVQGQRGEPGRADRWPRCRRHPAGAAVHAAMGRRRGVGSGRRGRRRAVPGPGPPRCHRSVWR